MSAEATESVGPASPHAALRAVFGLVTRARFTPRRRDRDARLGALGALRALGEGNSGLVKNSRRGSVRAEPAVQDRAAGGFDRRGRLGTAGTADQEHAGAEGEH